MDVQTSVTVKLGVNLKRGGGAKTKKRSRDAGGVLARKRAQQFKKRDANTRHLTGIVNQAEKNRLTNKEKLLDKTHKIREIQISRTKHQLRDELYEMQASKLALRKHSLRSMEPESDTERNTIERFSQRGRYLYAIRKEVKVQKHIMESYNERLEEANKLLHPARHQGDTAMDMGRNMGSGSPTRYLKIGKRLLLPPLTEHDDFSDSDDSDIERELVNLGRSRKQTTQPEVDVNKPVSSPRPDFVQIRSELGPELQMAIDKLELAELTELGIGLPSWSKASPAPPPKSAIDEVFQAQDVAAPTGVKPPAAAKGAKARLVLPPVRAKGRPQRKLPVQTSALDSSSKLSTVCENQDDIMVTS